VPQDNTWKNVANMMIDLFKQWNSDTMEQPLYSLEQEKTPTNHLNQEGRGNVGWTGNHGHKAKGCC
jgi:hypothetical protein